MLSDDEDHYLSCSAHTHTAGSSTAAALARRAGSLHRRLPPLNTNLPRLATDKTVVGRAATSSTAPTRCVGTKSRADVKEHDDPTAQSGTSSCCSDRLRRHNSSSRWSMGGEASALRGRRAESFGAAGCLAGARGMSTFLADALRETATSHGMRVVNGSLGKNDGVVRIVLVVPSFYAACCLLWVSVGMGVHHIIRVSLEYHLFLLLQIHQP